jgi:hypothetical protein
MTTEQHGAKDHVQVKKGTAARATRRHMLAKEQESEQGARTEALLLL